MSMFGILANHSRVIRHRREYRTNRAGNAVSAALGLAGELASLPFPFPLPLPFDSRRAPLSPFVGEPGVSLCAVALGGGAAEPSGRTTQSTKRRLPSRRSARQIANGSFCVRRT